MMKESSRQVLRHEVEAQLACDEEGEDACTLCAGAFAVGWVRPEEWEVADGGLGPAWS